MGSNPISHPIMIEILKALFAGITVGIFFSLFRLPIPAPTVLAGVLGVFGVYIGYLIVNILK